MQSKPLKNTPFQCCVNTDPCNCFTARKKHFYREYNIDILYMYYYYKQIFCNLYTKYLNIDVLPFKMLSKSLIKPIKIIKKKNNCSKYIFLTQVTVFYLHNVHKKIVT